MTSGLAEHFHSCPLSANPHMFGVPWIRGTFLSLDDLPPVKPQESR